MITPSADIVKRFSHHPPVVPGRVEEHEEVRALFLNLATQMETLLPPGRELSLCLTQLEVAMFWANASIARQ